MQKRKEETVTTYQDEIEVAGGEPFELVPEGPYTAVIDSIETFDGSNFKTGEPETKLKIGFRIDAGDWLDSKVESLVAIPKSMADDRATLHQIWKAATGEVPVAGGKYPVKAGLMGKRLTIMVEHKVNSRGSTWPRAKAFSRPPEPRRRQQQAAPPPTEEDDDLQDA